MAPMNDVIRNMVFLFCGVFNGVRVPRFVSNRHPTWDAPQYHGATRLHAVESWVGKHYEGQPVVVLDDAASGTGLRSRLDRAECVILCEIDFELHQRDIPSIRNALTPSIQRA